MPLAAIASLALLAPAAPAQVPSAPGSAQFSLHAGPLTVHGYKLTLDAGFGNVDVTFTRTAPGTTQTHLYHFDHVRLTAPRDMRSGRLKGTLGQLGSIDLRFRRSGAIHKRKLPPHCVGEPARHRAGRLTGTFRLAVDTTYFGTVSETRLPADLTRIGGSVCASTGVAPEFPGPLTLSAGGESNTTLTVIARKGGRSSQQAEVSTPSGTHEITSTGPAGSFTGSTAAATVLAAPGFSGTLAYSATNRQNKFVTDGALAGDYTALFDSIGPVTFAGAPGSVTGPS